MKVIQKFRFENPGRYGSGLSKFCGRRPLKNLLITLLNILSQMKGNLRSTAVLFPFFRRRLQILFPLKSFQIISGKIEVD